MRLCENSFTLMIWLRPVFFVMNLNDEYYRSCTEPLLSHINVGTGDDCTIRELAETIAKVVGFEGGLVFDASKPDGAPRKLMNINRLAELGWKYQVDLKTGLAKTYQWLLVAEKNLRS